MTAWPEHIAATTWHGRKGAVRNAFLYGVDFVLIDPDSRRGPLLFSRNGFNLTAVHDRHHGGQRGSGRGVAWVREVLQYQGLADHDAYQIRLLTQPTTLGVTFNPVSFWLIQQGDNLHAVIAEVNNTFGDRHSYFCAKPDLSAITAADEISAQKIFHVSPFQRTSGTYVFRFGITPTAVSIRIALSDGPDGVVATLQGPRKPASNAGLLAAGLRRPFGAARVVALIYWQALKLKFKGATYVPRPIPPTDEVS